MRIDDARPPRGGGAGGYNPTTFQGGIRPIPGDVIQNQTIDARAQNGAIAFWLTPHGFLKGIAANMATAKSVNGARQADAVVQRVRQVPDHRDARRSNNLIEHVEALVDIAYTGDTVARRHLLRVSRSRRHPVPDAHRHARGRLPDTRDRGRAGAAEHARTPIDAARVAPAAAPPAAAAPRAEPQPQKLAGRRVAADAERRGEHPRRVQGLCRDGRSAGR